MILPMATPLHVVLGGCKRVVYVESAVSNHDMEDPISYEKGAKGSYPVMVVERMEDRMIVVLGDTMVGGFIGAYASE